MVRVWVRVTVRIRLGDAVVRNAVGRKVGNRSEVEACLVNLVILITILYINILCQKPKSLVVWGRGDLTLLFFSKDVK